MIATLSQNEVATASTEISEYLENQVASIAPDPPFDYIHPIHKEFAQNTAREFNRTQVECIEDELRQGQQILNAKERLTRRGEFSRFKQSLSATAATIRKKVNLVLTFGDFPLEKIVAIAAATNIYALCAPKFAELVQKLRELPILAADVIRQMVKEARPPRKPKQQQESSVDWERDASGGGRHLNLYDDELNTVIMAKAQEEQITPQKVIAQAFEQSKKLDAVQQEFTEAVSEMRDKHNEMQQQLIERDRQLEERDCRILELKAELQQATNTVDFENLEQPTVNESKEQSPEATPRFIEGEVVRHHLVPTWIYTIVKHLGNGEYSVKKGGADFLSTYATKLREEELLPCN